MKTLLLSLALIAAAGCASKEVIQNPSNTVGEKGVISVASDWVKYKGKNVDFMLSLKNEGSNFLVIPFSDVVCMRGGEQANAEIPAGGFNTYHDTIQALAANSLGLNPSQNLKQLFTCHFVGAGEGPIDIKIQNVYVQENVNLRRVAGNIVWHASTN